MAKGCTIALYSTACMYGAVPYWAGELYGCGQRARASTGAQLRTAVPPLADCTTPTGIFAPSSRNKSRATNQQVAEKPGMLLIVGGAHGTVGDIRRSRSLAEEASCAVRKIRT